MRDAPIALLARHKPAQFGRAILAWPQCRGITTGIVLLMDGAPLLGAGGLNVLKTPAPARVNPVPGVSSFYSTLAETPKLVQERDDD